MADSNKEFQVEILTPDKKVFSGYLNYVKAPGSEGYFGIMCNHAPLLSALRIGELEIKSDSKRQYFAIGGGFLEVLQNHVRILAETAEAAPDIDTARAKAAKERAENRLAVKSPDVNLDRARSALFRAVNRLKIAERR